MRVILIEVPASLAEYEKLLAEASKYGQVYLPEEIFVPLETTEVQGIEFGMPREDAWRALVENGYLKFKGQRKIRQLVLAEGCLSWRFNL